MNDPLFPVALTIAGSDSGGGAGIQADLRAFRAFHVHGCTAITALTAQNPHGVRSIQATDPAVLRDQLDCIADDFAVKAVKTGMLADTDRIAVVADCLPRFWAAALIVDPVMVATSGAKLLADEAIEALITRIIPRATLITPNLPESNLLLGKAPSADIADLRAQAETLSERYGVSVLLKGGHHADRTATDYLATAQGDTFEITSPIVEKPLTTHGTGCSLSAAIAANLAQGEPLPTAICRAKAWVFSLLQAGVCAGNTAVYGCESPDLPCDLIELRRLSDR